MSDVGAIGMKPMYIRPHAGQQIILQMNDGSQVKAMATMVRSDHGSGIIIYAGRRSVDEAKCRGWFPQVQP
jgi:hypothetical protein